MERGGIGREGGALWGLCQLVKLGFFADFDAKLRNNLVCLE